MRFFPKNKFLVVEPSANKKPDHSGILLPDDLYKEPFTLAKVLETCPDSTYSRDQMILFPTHTMEEVDISGSKLFFVPENVIYGVME